MSKPMAEQAQKEPSSPPTKPAAPPQLPLHKIIFKNLIMGGISGIIGASSVYPLDMIKTRMQVQRSTGTPMYNGIVDCFQKIFNKEGVRGLYRGLPAQLVGITPEKAIKLTVNDLLRGQFTNKETGRIPVVLEGVAGAAAGFSQVIVTGPYELVKVRLQTQVAEAGKIPKGGFAIVRELGFRGLFTGAGATLLRDVPFSAMYFTTYGNLKRMLSDEHGHMSGFGFLFCGLASGTFSAVLATPADVIKTRLQAKHTEGPKYLGIRDCFNRILKEEGPKAFFKGSVPRMLIISPLFGITLCVYELMKGFFLPPEANAK